jgi:hypothetical protein
MLPVHPIVLHAVVATPAILSEFDVTPAKLASRFKSRRGGTHSINSPGPDEVTIMVNCDVSKASLSFHFLEMAPTEKRGRHKNLPSRLDVK